MTCPRCQSKITASDRYCVNCGADIALISQNIRPADVMDDEDPGPVNTGSGWSTASGLSAVQGPGGRGGKIAMLVALHLCLFIGAAYAAHWYLDSRASAGAPENPGLSLGKPRLVTPGQPDEPAQPEPSIADEPGVDKPRRRPRRPRRRTSKKKTSPVAAAPAKTRPGHPAPDPAAKKEATPVAKAEPAAEPGKTEPGRTEPAGEPGKTEPAKTEPGTSARAADAGAPAKASPPAKMGNAEKFAVSLNVGSVQMVVRHRLPQLRLCYGRNIKGLAVRGVVEIKFTVNKQGRVSSAAVHRGHQAVGKCIVGKLKTWRFPRPVGGEMTFIYPFKITS